MKTKKIIIALTISLLANFSIAQVGVGTTTPAGALDITSTNDGLLIPRIALSATNVATVITPTTSELVYNTFTSAVGANQVTPGFYYWNGTLWVRMTTGTNNDWTLTGNAGTAPATNFLGTTDAQPLVIRTNNTEKIRIKSNGKVGIGEPNPTDATLEVKGNTIIGNTFTGGNSVAQPGGLTVEGRTIIGEDAFYYGIDKVVVYGNTTWIPTAVTNGDNGNGLTYAINGYTSDGVGLYAEDNDGGRGVEANVFGTATNRATGVSGFDTSGRGYGVVGISENSSVTNGYRGVYGVESTLTGYALYATGRTYSTGAYFQPSDKQLKKNIKPLKNALEIIEKLSPKTYDFRWDEDKFKKAGLERGTQMGFIAQDLEETLPNIVNQTELSLDFPTYTKKQIEENPSLKNEQEKTMQIKAVNYDQLIPLLTQAIKEQQEIIKSLEARIEKLEKK
ncbi:tail fiber domain-containing protein [Flavobacterium sp.]|jgi:hypothetical protein|uniref:tail fiber domain-containing protein n=1 Tax=Flavobacterium sp. TaxID=239 RepID=UPI002A80FC8E|nr:tail fiber domain-containing protein [Flavobacterium sp.]